MVDYFDRHSDEVEAHPGAVLEELAILRILQNNEAAEPTIITAVYREKMVRGCPTCPNPADIYGMTHDVFFATDFGRQQFTGYDTEAWSALLQRLAIEQWGYPDLLGEILMCAICLDLWGPWADEALTHYRTLWDALDRTAGGFNENHHPILVGDLLFAMLGG